MRIRDKIITAACRTPDGIEWTTLRIKQDGPGRMEQSSCPMPRLDDPNEEALAELQVPAALAAHLEGDVTVALRTSELLMRTMAFPTADPAEIAAMARFQVDKVSPFPIEQLAVSQEILRDGGDSADVLMAAAKRNCIDAIGESFGNQGIHIHSIDARILGWLELMRAKRNLPEDNCEILVVDDGIDLTLVVLNNGLPLAFRSLDTDADDMNIVDELIYEIGYTLTTLDTIQDLPIPSAIHFWSLGDIPPPLRAKLSEKSGVKVLFYDLNSLPPLSQGIAERALQGPNRIELIPREWVDLQQRKQMLKQFALISGAIAAVWLVVLLAFFAVYKARDAKLAGIQAEADALRPMAEQALENRRKLQALKVYTDRSDSSLESLREVTRLLPRGDIEFVSFNYTKGKAVSLRGTSRSKNLVNDYFSSLAKSALFDGTKDVSTSLKTTKGIQRTVYSVTLPFPEQEAGQ
jgi:Tfp pilus assembly protein PilN